MAEETKATDHPCTECRSQRAQVWWRLNDPDARRIPVCRPCANRLTANVMIARYEREGR